MEKSQFKVLFSLLNKKIARTELTGMFVDFDKKEIAVTDHVMLVVVKGCKFLEGTGKVIIPYSVCELVSKAKTKEITLITNDCIFAGDFKFPFNSYEEEYPNYTRSLDKDLSENGKGFFGLYRSKHLKILEEIENEFAGTNKFKYKLPNSIYQTLRVHASNEYDVTILIHPRQVETENACTKEDIKTPPKVENYELQ